MNFSKVKLIASDMDGTLLNSKHKVSTEFYTLFKQLKELDVLFIAASGRPYYSIVEKLATIKNDIGIIAENGGVIAYKDFVSSSLSLPTSRLIDIEKAIDKLNNVTSVYCSKDLAFIKPLNDENLNAIKEYYSNYRLIDSISDITTKIVKVALYHSISSEKHIYPFVKFLDNDLRVLVSANHWVDISDQRIDKGNALEEFQKIHHISFDETMVFGDYNNDYEMLKKAKFSVAMDNAHPAIKAISNITTSSNDDMGVEQILRKVIKAKQTKL